MVGAGVPLTGLVTVMQPADRGRPAAAGGGVRSSDRHTASVSARALAQSPNRPGGASPASADRVAGLVRPARSAFQNPSVNLGRRHRRLGARRAVTALVSPGHSGPAARARSCLTRVGHRPVVWPHEIPDSGISHRNSGSSPRSGTEAGDISPVFAALEHAAGDLTTLGKNPLLEGSSPPSDTQSGGTSPFLEHRLNTRTARLMPAASPRR